MKNLNEDIKTGIFKSVYLLYGEEEYLVRLYKNRIKKAVLPEDDTMNFSRYEGKGISVPELIDQAETMPFFADHRLILIEKSGFFKEACEELAAYIPEIPAETILVFAETEVDKRGRLYKAVAKKGSAVEMKRQDIRSLKTWVLGKLKREGKEIRQDALDLFLEKAGDDMENIETELEKVLCYTYGERGISARDVEAVCTVTTENRIFEMIRAMADKRQKQALGLYYDLLALKEAPLRILALIARQYNQMLAVKDMGNTGMDYGRMADRMGLNPYVVKKVLSQTGKYTLEELKSAVADCIEAEESVKTGKMGDKMAVEMLIVKYSS